MFIKIYIKFSMDERVDAGEVLKTDIAIAMHNNFGESILEIFQNGFFKLNFCTVTVVKLIKF